MRAVATRYSVIGLGKLGSCMAAAIAARGFEVVGADLDPRAVGLLDSGHAPVVEPGLEELVAGNRQRLRATLSTREAVLASDVTFVVVPTPSEPHGGYSLEQVARAFGETGRALAEKEAYHLVALTSTVLPGATRHVLVPVLERASGKRCGEDFGLCYSPEFVALGSVAADFLNPDFVLIGEHDERAGQRLEACYAELVENGAPCRRMGLENAELAKIALNAFVTTKIAFANTLAALCERIPGGDVDAVTTALGLDRRIGSAYLRGGLGFGGPCFPRDNAAFGFLASALGVEAPIARATHRSNAAIPARVVERLRPFVRPGARVALLGLAYKPGTNVVEESQALDIARALAAEGAHVRCFDPLVRAAPATSGCELAPSLEECLADAEVVVLASAELATAAQQALGRCAQGAVVLDCWRALGPEPELPPSIRVVALGRGGEDAGDGALADLWELDEGDERAAAVAAAGGRAL